MSDLISRPYHPNPDKACEACVFGAGSHAEWCDPLKRVAPKQPESKPPLIFYDVPPTIREFREQVRERVGLSLGGPSAAQRFPQAFAEFCGSESRVSEASRIPDGLFSGREPNPDAPGPESYVATSVSTPKPFN